MTRLRDEYKIANINIADVRPEIAPLPQRKDLKKSLFGENGTKQTKQYDTITVAIAPEGPYKYWYKNGRTRGEFVRENNPNGTIRAIIQPYEGERNLHIHALVANSGKPNIPDEALHCAYLRDNEKMNEKQIADETGLKIHTVRGRLFIYDKLHPDVFKMFQRGDFTYSAALSLAKMPQESQLDCLNDIDYLHGQTVTQKYTEEYRRGLQSQKTSMIKKMFDTSNKESPVILSVEQLEKLMSDETVSIEFRGKQFEICRCEWN